MATLAWYLQKPGDMKLSSLAATVTWLALLGASAAEGRVSHRHPARVDTPSTSERLNRYRSILIDATANRSGAGDVAAGYLTAQDMVKRLGYRGSIRLFVSSEGVRILSRMIGASLSDGGVVARGRHGRVILNTPLSLPGSLPAVDLHIALARKDGTPAELRFRRGPSEHGRVPVDRHTVRISLPTFAATESKVTRDNGSILVGDRGFEMRPPGVGPTESGIYADSLARRLRGKSDRWTTRFLRRIIRRKVAQEPVREALLGLIGDQLLAGSQRTVSYSLRPKIRDQVEKYLEGLTRDAAAHNRSHTIITPRELPEDVTRTFESVVVLDPARGAKLPRRATPGKVYIVKVPTLPHAVFVTMLKKYHDLPAVIGGDGSISAAIALGTPFVMPSVPWNRKVIDQYRRRVTEAAGSRFSPSLARLFDPDAPALDRTLSLRRPGIRRIFGKASGSIGLLTERLVSAADSARSLSSGVQTLEEIQGIGDSAMRTSCVLHAASRGAPWAARLAERLIERHPARFLAMMARGSGVSAEILGQPRVRRALQRMCDSKRTELVGPLLAGLRGAGTAAAASFLMRNIECPLFMSQGFVYLKDSRKAMFDIITANGDPATVDRLKAYRVATDF